MTLQFKRIFENKLLQKYPRLLVLEQQSQCRSLNQLKQMLSYIIVSGLHRNPYVMSRVLYSCFFDLEQEDGKLETSDATLIFSQILKPNIFTWNTMIKAFAITSNDSNTAFWYYKEMLCRGGVFPDKYTYPFLLQACRDHFDVEFVKQVHSHSVMLGHGTNLYVQNSFLHSYLAFGSVFDGSKLFDEMIEKDVVSWTTLISGLVTQGYFAQGLLVLNKMLADELSIYPNVATMVSIMSACANLGSLDHARALHAYLNKTGWLETKTVMGNSLIDVYSKCGSISCACRVFDETHSSQRDTISWTSMIAGFAMHGLGADAIRWFAKMKQVMGMHPDSVTFISVLSACAHAGLVDEGVKIFESMEVEFGIVPEIEHYGCMVDLFGRAGLLKCAYRILEIMPMKPNLAILGSLLSACRVHNDVELGEVVLEKINSCCDYSGGANVLLSNMYASGKQWCDVVHVRKGISEDDNKRKPPGQSWIQVKGDLHEFVVGDNSKLAMELYPVLDGFKRQLFLDVH